MVYFSIIHRLWNLRLSFGMSFNEYHIKLPLHTSSAIESPPHMEHKNTKTMEHNTQKKKKIRTQTLNSSNIYLRYKQT